MAVEGELAQGFFPQTHGFQDDVLQGLEKGPVPFQEKVGICTLKLDHILGRVFLGGILRLVLDCKGKRKPALLEDLPQQPVNRLDIAFQGMNRSLFAVLRVH